MSRLDAHTLIRAKLTRGSKYFNLTVASKVLAKSCYLLI